MRLFEDLKRRLNKKTHILINISQEMGCLSSIICILLLKNIVMSNQKTTDFARISNAIEYISNNYKQQPNLDEIAEHINLSPSHFQKMFTEWAGVSPKQFLQYITLSYAKGLLRQNEASLFDVAFKVGLSSTSRLHDLFIKIESMTPGEYKNGGENLIIKYNYAPTPFGEILIASTHKGICHIAFADDKLFALDYLKSMFPNANYIATTDTNQQTVLKVFTQDLSNNDKIKLHIKGTPFQLKVWETLLRIPMGELVTYGDIAKQLDNPNANRAVGSAVGSNPIAFLIPCHRVIQSTGIFGHYHWGSTRKTAMIGWEAAQKGNNPDDEKSF